MNADDIKKEENKRQEFTNILLELSNNQLILRDGNERSKIYKRLEALYWDDEKGECYRHFYSDIFSVLTQIQQNIVSGANIDILGQNIFVIRNGYRVQNKDKKDHLINIEDSLRKLYDHVSLDIARMRYMESADISISGDKKIKSLKRDIGQVENEAKTLNDEVDVLKKQLSNSQKEYITILGIFASIVLTFVGGIAFSSSVLQNIHKASIYRLVLTVDLLAFSITNIINLLLKFIWKINNKEDYGKLINVKCLNFIYLYIGFIIVAARIVVYIFKK